MFLRWIDPDRARAAYKYEEIRRSLISIFKCRGCAIAAEELADVTIDRVICKTSEIADSYDGDAARYCYRVSRHVYLEYLRKRPIPVSPIPAIAEESSRVDVRFDCLDRCLESLSPASREIITLYYQEAKGSRLDARKHLADEMAIPMNALRVRIHRIRSALSECVKECMKEPNG